MKQFVTSLIFFVLLISSCHAVDCISQSMVSEDKSVISRTYLDAIESSDSVVWYILDPMSEDSSAVRLGEKWEVLSCKTDNSQSRCDTLKNVMTGSASFVRDSMVRESTFLPDVAVVFYSKKAKCNVRFLYSFYCDLCHFECGQKYQEINGDLIRKRIIEMVSSVFPQDRYLRQLKRKG